MDPDGGDPTVRPDDDDGEPGLAVAAVARRLGVAPATLRTWDRRYGLGPSGHAPGRHRRYSAVDLARLELMHRELTRGVAPADAARFALSAAPPAIPAAAPVTAVPAPIESSALTSLPAAGSGWAAPALGGPAPGSDVSVPAAVPSPSGPPAAGRGAAPMRVGGRVLRLPGANRRARGLGRAALSMDSAAVRRLLTDSVLADGLVTTWETVALPVLVAVADRWESTGTGVEIEHLVSDSVTAVFHARALAAEPMAGARPVVLAGMPDEHHVLALTVLAAVLAERGVPCRPLGADLPADALAAALRRTAPAALVLWSQLPATADVAVLAALPRTRPRFRTFVAGPGWDGAALPDRIGRLTSLTGATNALAELVARPPAASR